MELSAVLMARAVALIETADLNPRGKSLYPALIQALLKRYGFQKVPEKIEELDEAKGIEFLEGSDGETAIGRLVIWNSALALETRSSTEKSRDILERALAWGQQEFGLTYHPGMVKRWGYVNVLSFHTEVPILDAISQPLQNLARRTTAALEEAIGEHLDYKTTAVTLTYDQLLRKYSVAGFIVQRRADVPFSENKYFSEAPLPTEVHISLLTQLEAEVQASMPQARLI